MGVNRGVNVSMKNLMTYIYLKVECADPGEAVLCSKR